MPNPSTAQTLKSDLTLHWLVVVIMLLILCGYIIFCQNLPTGLPHTLPEEKRIWLRTLCYALAIILFPLTNLIRHIQLRLNQTMPGNKSAKKCYLLTIAVSMILIHGVGVLGLVMFLLGDDVNTLYILVGMSALGVYLYRPKNEEYQRIIEALISQNQAAPTR